MAEKAAAKAEEKLLGETNGQGETKAEKPAIDVEALLKKQAEEFKAQLDAMAERNNKLAEELTNLKSNTAEENRLLGETIAAIQEGKEPAPKYDPYNPDLLYKVHNETAGIDTIMTGDEVEGIVGVISVHLTQKLIEGAKEIEKHPYKITLLGKADELTDKDLKLK